MRDNKRTPLRIRLEEWMCVSRFGAHDEDDDKRDANNGDERERLQQASSEKRESHRLCWMGDVDKLACARIIRYYADRRRCR
jgi:hypothetical protein